jgi:hypothetical protein
MDIGGEALHHPVPPMTTIQEIAAKLAAQGMNSDEMISFIYGCTTYANLAEITVAVQESSLAV